MTRNDVLKLIAQGEGPQVEFKEEATKPSRLAESLVAFANAEGGTLLIGVEDCGHAQGVKDPKRALDNVVEAIGHCSPPLGVALPQAVETKPGVVVLAVEVPRHLPRVYHVYGRYLRRSSSMNLALDETALRRLFYERGEISFEAEPVSEASLADLDLVKVNAFRQRYEFVYGRGLVLPDRDMLLAMGCLSRGGKPTQAGVLLFGQDPRRFFFEPHVSIARYRGNSVGAENRLDTRDFYGTILEAAVAAADYLNEHVPLFSRLLPDKVMRQDVPQYPRFAIREILINALVHRDWSLKGSRVLVKMFPDRMEVQSPGPFPPPVTARNIRQEHHLRNPRIAQAFKDFGLIEKFGNGIDRVFEEIATHPFRPRLPDFHDTGASVVVTLYGAVMPAEEAARAARTEVVTFHINERQGKALEYLKGNGRMTRNEYCRVCQVEKSKAYQELHEMVRQGLIARHGKGRGVYYAPIP